MVALTYETFWCLLNPGPVRLQISGPVGSHRSTNSITLYPTASVGYAFRKGQPLPSFFCFFEPIYIPIIDPRSTPVALQEQAQL